MRSSLVRRSYQLATIAGAVICLGLVVSWSGNGGGQHEKPVLQEAVARMQQLSYGIPETYGEETVHRMPTRSVDPMGDALPAVAEEQQPPGYWVGAGQGQIIESHPTAIPPAASRPQMMNSLQITGLTSLARVPSVNSKTIGVHVASSPAGKVIYYPYPSASASSFATSSVQSYAEQAPLLQSQTQSAVQTEGGNGASQQCCYNGLSQKALEHVNSEQIEQLQGELRKQKEESRKRLEKVKRRVWREHKSLVKLKSEDDRLRVHLSNMEFKWRNGPYPNLGPPGVAGPKGAPGTQGQPGSSGVQGPTGPRGKKGKKYVFTETVAEPENAAKMSSVVKADVKSDLERMITQRLDKQSKKMAQLEQANQRLIEKMKALKGPSKAQLYAEHPNMFLRQKILKLMGTSPKIHKLPPGWERLERRGKLYYENTKTGKTQWNRPKIGSS